MWSNIYFINQYLNKKPKIKIKIAVIFIIVKAKLYRLINIPCLINVYLASVTINNSPSFFSSRLHICTLPTDCRLPSKNSQNDSDLMLIEILAILSSKLFLQN